MTAHEDALSLAATLNPGILARAIECEKTAKSLPPGSTTVESFIKAGVAYRRQLADVAAVIELVLKARDQRVTSADMEAASEQPIKMDLLTPPSICTHCYGSGLDCDAYGQFPCGCEAGLRIGDNDPRIGPHRRS